MANWEDETSYSRGDKERVPRTWTCRLGGHLRVTVTRHIHYPPDDWLLFCLPFFDGRVLKAKDIKQAKCEALLLVKEKLREAMRQLP